MCIYICLKRMYICIFVYIYIYIYILSFFRDDVALVSWSERGTVNYEVVGCSIKNSQN